MKYLPRKRGSIESELEKFAKESNVKLGRTTNFDDEYDWHFAMKSKQLGF